MCSYCGCRNIPMIAQLNAEHDAIVNSSYALEIAFRDQDVDAARTACKELGELLHPHTRREENGLFAEMKKDELFTEHVASLCADARRTGHRPGRDRRRRPDVNPEDAHPAE